MHENIFENEDSQDFYLQMVSRIYEEYVRIRVSSVEIEKIMACYMRVTSSDFDEDRQSYRYLDTSIFNYFVESDETLKVRMRGSLEPHSNLR